VKVLQDRVETLEEKHEFIEQHGLLRTICICVYIYATKVLAHETWTTQASHRAAFVQQKSPPTYKELISYGRSSSRTR